MNIAKSQCSVDDWCFVFLLLGVGGYEMEKQKMKMAEVLDCARSWQQPAYKHASGSMRVHGHPLLAGRPRILPE